MVSHSLPKPELEKCICIQSNPSKWNGLLIGSLKRVIEQVHPSLTASDEALEYVEMLVIQCLEILTLRPPQPHTVLDIEDQVRRSFPKPIEKWAIKDAKDALEKNKKRNPLVLPTDKIYNLVLKEILPYKVEYQVAVYITAVLEYIAADILKLAGNYVKNIHRVDIGLQDLRVAIYGDKVLMDLFGQHDDNSDLNLSDLGIDKIQRTTTYEEVIRDLMHDERQLIRDLHLILKIFKEEIDRIIPRGSSQELDSMFNNITDICKATGLFLSSIEDILEIAEDKSATVGCCIEELAEAAEFDVFARYANDIVKKQCRDVFFNLIGKPEVSNLLQSAGYGFKEAVKYYFPKLLLLPLWHCILYFEYIKILHQLSPSQLDKECLEQVEGILRPLQLQMTSAATKVNLPDNVKEFGLKINATPRRLLAIEKLNEVQKSIDNWDGKDMGQCCTEFIREGILKKVSSGGKRCSERKAILFDGVLLLCKSNNRRTSVSVSSQLVGGLSEFRLKEKLFIRKVEIVDREDTEETKHFFEIAPRLLQPPIVLVANTYQDKANWMADLVMLNTKSMLDRTLNSILHDEDKKFPLRLPSVEEYRFIEPDSRSNIIFEEKENNGVPLIKGAVLLKLIERLTYHIYADPKFVKTFLTTYRSFCSPHDLLDLLFERYNIPEPFGITMDSISLRDENKRFKKEYLVPVQFRVLNVIRHWVDYHYYDYQRDQSLLDKLHAFLDSINGKSMKKWADSVIKILQRKTTEAQKEITFAFDSPPPPIEVHMDFNENEEFNILLVHPIEFARQLTLIESENYRAVKPSELVGSVWTKKDKEINSPHLLRLIKHTTNFSRWIEKVVVECENFEERVAVVSRFIEVMMALFELNNFNGVLGVHSAMSSAAVFRLKNTFLAVDKNARLEKALEDARELSNHHFKKYQDKLRKINPPCVPFMGMYLTNILHIEEGNPDCLINSPNLINFNKRRKVAEIIGEIQQYQNQPYCLNVEPKIKKFLENLNPFNDKIDTDISTYLFEKSLVIEPRHCKQLLKYPRKWPDLNLKSPGIKPKIRVPSVSSKDMDVQGRRKLSSSGSLVIQMDKREAEDSVFSPVTFKTPNGVPPVPPRLSKIDNGFRPPIPPRTVAPPLPPRRLQAEQIKISPNKVVDILKPEINQDFNTIKKPTPSIIPSKKLTSPPIKPINTSKSDSVLEHSDGLPLLKQEAPQSHRFPFKPFILKRTAPSMFQFNIFR